MPVRRFAAVLTALFLASPLSASADMSPTKAGLPLNPAEQKFVSAIQSDLGNRFATAADAQKAGYRRYTNADETGAISYTNLQWTSTDARHPSQLWYDRSGNLLGADFSKPYLNGSSRPHWLGIDPGRWYEFDTHIHYVAKDPKTGKFVYDKYILEKPYTAAGGDMEHPSAAVIAKMKLVAKPSDVAWTFDFPAVWDLIVWVKPNPKGAFAEKNPNVKP